MIKFNEAKIGCFVNVSYNGALSFGEIVELNKNEKQICVQTAIQEFWFSAEDIFPIELNEEALLSLNFTKQPNEDGSVKYMKGSFRLVTPKAGDFSKLEMWYREDKRHNPNVGFVHELQNQYYDMTKIHLTKELV